MMIEKTMLTLILSILVLGCNPGKPHGSNSVDADGLATLPRITHAGISYPYTRYSESTGQTASHGRAFFLYPIKTSKTEILALEYVPGMRISDLFGEDLFGTGGQISKVDNQIRVRFLPISLPIGVVHGQRWRLTYAKREFLCEAKTDTNAYQSVRLRVSCSSGKYTLSFTFDRDLGITEFQDFCDFSVCTYKLMDSLGLLSRAMTLSMDLPNI